MISMRSLFSVLKELNACCICSYFFRFSRFTVFLDAGSINRAQHKDSSRDSKSYLGTYRPIQNSTKDRADDPADGGVQVIRRLTEPLFHGWCIFAHQGDVRGADLRRGQR